MKFKNIFLVLFLFSIPFAHCMEKDHASIAGITQQLSEVSLEEVKPHQPSNQEKQQALTILSLREQIIKTMHLRSTIENSVTLSIIEFAKKLKPLKDKLFKLYKQAEILYSESSHKTHLLLNDIEQKALESSQSSVSYTFCKLILAQWLLLKENQKENWDDHFKEIKKLHHNKKPILNDFLDKETLKYKYSVALSYAQLKADIEKTKLPSILPLFSLDCYLLTAKPTPRNFLFKRLFIIHSLLLHKLITNQYKNLLTKINTGPLSPTHKRLKLKQLKKNSSFLTIKLSTTIDNEITKIKKYPLPQKIKNELISLLKNQHRENRIPPHFQYLDYLHKNSINHYPAIIIQTFSEKYIDTVLNSSTTQKAMFVTLINESLGLPQEQLNPRPEATKKNSHRNKSIVQKTNAAKKKRGRKKRGNKKRITAKPNIKKPQQKNNSKKNEAKEHDQAEEQEEVVAQKAPQQTLKPTRALNPDHYINPKEDIIHVNKKKYACILDLIRALFDGYQSKVFIPKNPTPLPYNPLEPITYSQHVLNKKMSRENDNNHAFSPLVRQFGQHGYIVDQILTDIQKKALGTKHHIQNSTQYTLQHTVYLPARIASLGYPIERFEQQGCSPSGEFEFTFVQKDKDDPGICIHRFFRPYN